MVSYPTYESDRQTHRYAHTHIHRWGGRQTLNGGLKDTGGQINRRADKQTDTDEQTDRQTNEWRWC